ncbi:MAG: CopD family protein [Gammaproteobacteria bacterium]|nr:CopD family protein [Gammaproteobacteria bacterium]
MIEASLPLLQRWIGYVSVLGLLGVAAWIAWVRRAAPSRLRAGLSPEDTGSAIAALTGRVERIGLGAALGLVLAWALAFVVQVAAFRDPFVPLREDVAFLLWNTSWGIAWLVQGSVGVVLLLVFLRLVRSRRHAGRKTGETTGESGRMSAGWRSVAALVLLLPLTQALSGHAMGETGLIRVVAVGADAMHGLAAGIWIGSLAVILLAHWPAPVNRPLLTAQFRAFSPLAVLGVALLVGAGGVLSVIHLQALPDLWHTVYGRTLLAKVTVAVGALALGYRNWRKGLPRIEETAGETERVRVRAAIEVVAALTVLGLTAFLTALPTPE